MLGEFSLGPIEAAWHLPETAWFRLFNRGLHFKLPGSFHYFSERYGYDKPLINILDFRVFYLSKHGN